MIAKNHPNRCAVREDEVAAILSDHGQGKPKARIRYTLVDLPMLPKLLQLILAALAHLTTFKYGL